MFYGSQLETSLFLWFLFFFLFLLVCFVIYLLVVYLLYLFVVLFLYVCIFLVFRVSCTKGKNKEFDQKIAYSPRLSLV